MSEIGKNKKNTANNKSIDEKVTWNVIYKDFKQRHPNLSKMALAFRPLDFATIEIYMNDGSRIKYNYDLKRAEFIS